MIFIEQHFNTIYVIGFFLSSFLFGYLSGLDKAKRNDCPVELWVYGVSLCWPLIFTMFIVLLSAVIILLPGVIGNCLANGSIKELFSRNKKQKQKSGE